MSDINPYRKKALYNRRYYRKNRKESSTDSERKLPLNVRVAASLVGRLSRLAMEGAATGRHPWKTMTECVSRLIMDGLRWRRENDDEDGTIAEMLPHLEAMEHLNKIRTMRREGMTMLNTAREEISHLEGIGAHDGAVAYYHMTMETLGKLQATEWRDWLIRELEKAFPKLQAQKVRGVNLDPTRNIPRNMAAKKPLAKRRRGR